MNYLAAFGIDLSLEIDRYLRHHCRTYLGECGVLSTRGGGLESNLHLLINKRTSTNVMLVQRVPYSGGEYHRAYCSQLEVPAALDHNDGVLCIGGDAHGERIRCERDYLLVPRRQSFKLMLKNETVYTPPRAWNYLRERAVIDRRYVCPYYREESIDPREALEALTLLAK